MIQNKDKVAYSILYEDEDVIAVYKKRDVLSIRTLDKKTFSHNLYHYLHEYLAVKNEKLFIVHRLDYETSGVMVFAKKAEVKEKLQRCFEAHTVGRFYEGVLTDHLDLGAHFHVVQYLEEKGQKVIVSDKEHGKESVTDFEVTNYIQIGTAVAISIGTGRRNQIRLAIKSLGYTLLGDKRIGNSEAKRMYLNEYKLVFPPESGLKTATFATTPLWITKQ